MIESLKQLLGIGPSVDYRELVRKGAIILDVRTKGEYTGDHINGSINISLDQLTNNLHKLPKKEKPIITCCASGMRSSSAKSILKSHGYSVVHNGGSWQGLKHKI